MRKFLAGTVVFFAGMAVVDADTIIVGGKQYSNVLVYESSSYYYVKLPREGRSLSVRKSEVPSNQVEINEDPYYREQLRELYDDVKLRGDAALLDAKPIDSAFADAPQQRAVSLDASTLLSGGGGKPLKLTVAEAQELFKQAQINLTKSGNGYAGKSPDGIMSVRLTESNNQVTSISGSITSTDPTQIQGKAMALGMIAGQVAPWAGSWMMTSQQTLMSTGSIKKTQDGVGISIQVTAAGLTFSIRGV